MWFRAEQWDRERARREADACADGCLTAKVTLKVRGERLKNIHMVAGQLDTHTEQKGNWTYPRSLLRSQFSLECHLNEHLKH